MTPPGKRRPETGRSARPTRPALSREYILQTTLKLIDRDGVEAFSMRKLGAELGVDPMSVYHYLPNKGALFDGVTELLWTGIDLETDPQADWTVQAATAMRQFRAILRDHPRVVPIVGTRPGVTPAMLDLIDVALGQLVAAGLTATDAMDLMNCLAAYTIGHVLAEVGEPVGGDEVDAAGVYTALTADTHPHLATALSSGYTYDPDAQFERGLTALIAGWHPSHAVAQPNTAGEPGNGAGTCA